MKTQTTQLKPVGARIASTSAGLTIRLNIYRAAVLALFFAGATLFSTSAASADTITVTNTNDSGPGSLRDALAIANDGDTIDATGISGTILLTSGQLQITHNVTINGPGAGTLTVNGNATSRVFYNSAPNVTISGFTITNGNAADNGLGGGILNLNTTSGELIISDCSIVSNTAEFPFPPNNGQGGGIYSQHGTLTVTNSTISNNSSNGVGGGINTDYGTMTVTNSVISGNSAIEGKGSGGGGGIGFEFGATLTVTNSTINGNSADGFGGGIYNDFGMTTVTNSVISGNSASSANFSGGGGGIDLYAGTVTVTNSTISGNSADGAYDVGGGILNLAGSLTVTNSTISANSAPTGGDIFNGATAQIGDTVLNAGAGGTIANAGTFISLGYNLASDDGGGVLTGPSDQINTDPMLGPLQDNGGPTFTHALLPGSPAIDAGDPNFTPPPFYDQRGAGFNRVANGRIDKGSFEVQTGATPTPTATAIATATATATPTGTATATPTASATATRTPTPTPTATSTATPTATATATLTATPTPTATVIATPTATPRPSPTPRSSPAPRPRPTPPPRP